MNLENHLGKFGDFLGLKTNKRGGKNVEGTIEKYTTHVRQFYEIMGISDYKQVTNDVLEQYVLKLNTMEYTKGHTTKKYDTNALIVKKSAMMNYVEFLAKKCDMPLDWRELKEETLKPEKMRVKPVDTFTDDELKRLDEVTKYNLRDNAMHWTLLVSGSRRTDVTKTNISDFDFQQHTLKMYDTKTKTWKVKNIPKECIEAVQKYLDVRVPSATDPDALFTTIYGKRMDTRYLYDLVRQWGDLAKIRGKRVSPHIYKHTCISKLAKNGWSAIEIQAHVGNASLQTLQNYIHLNHWDIKDKMEKIVW